MESCRRLDDADILCADGGGGESCWWGADSAIALSYSSPTLDFSRLDILSCNSSVIVGGILIASVIALHVELVSQLWSFIFSYSYIAELPVGDTCDARVERAAFWFSNWTLILPVSYYLSIPPSSPVLRYNLTIPVLDMIALV